MILTIKYLRSIVENKIYNQQSRQATINENLRIFREKNKYYDLFISHSFKDKELIEELIHLFNSCNYSVYVDWIEDKDLNRDNVTVSTANLIRERVQSSKGLAYVATKSVSQSKWCPWELGYSDGRLKGRSCILPVLESESLFKGQEYLGLYPYIEYSKVKDKSKYDFWVFDPQDSKKYVILREWLNGQEPSRK